MTDQAIPRPDPERKDRLAGVHPRLVAVVADILPMMAILGHPMFVVEGVRSLARQQALYAQGRTGAGRNRPIVTYVDGTRIRGPHQVQADGYAHAVDLAFQGSEPWASTHPWNVYGALVEWYGLRWGGGWKAFRDCPHMELIHEAAGAPVRAAADGTTQTSTRPAVG